MTAGFRWKVGFAHPQIRRNILAWTGAGKPLILERRSLIILHTFFFDGGCQGVNSGDEGVLQGAGLRHRDMGALGSESNSGQEAKRKREERGEDRKGTSRRQDCETRDVSARKDEQPQLRQE